jgi:hypothetical protein
MLFLYQAKNLTKAHQNGFFLDEKQDSLFATKALWEAHE